MTSVLEEYSRTGDLRVLQRLSSFMGASPQVGSHESCALRSWFLNHGVVLPAPGVCRLPPMPRLEVHSLLVARPA